MRMVADNVERLKRIVDDVMEVARALPDATGIDATTAMVPPAATGRAGRQLGEDAAAARGAAAAGRWAWPSTPSTCAACW